MENRRAKKLHVGMGMLSKQQLVAVTIMPEALKDGSDRHDVGYDNIGLQYSTVGCRGHCCLYVPLPQDVC